MSIDPSTFLFELCTYVTYHYVSCSCHFFREVGEFIELCGPLAYNLNQTHGLGLVY
jgi:hypothetical protein